MQFGPEFEKLIDAKVKRAVDQYVRPSWFDVRTVWLGMLGSLAASLLIWSASNFFSSKGQADDNHPNSVEERAREK